MEYKRAVRENTNVLIALAGASGSGKTYSGHAARDGHLRRRAVRRSWTPRRDAACTTRTSSTSSTSALGPPFTPALPGRDQAARRNEDSEQSSSTRQPRVGRRGRRHRAGGRIEQERAVELDRTETPAQKVRERLAPVRHESDHLPARGRENPHRRERVEAEDHERGVVSRSAKSGSCSR